jgi:hypothetical protein
MLAMLLWSICIGTIQACVTCPGSVQFIGASEQIIGAVCSS